MDSIVNRLNFSVLREIASLRSQSQGVVFARSVSDEAISLSIGLTHHGVTQQVSLLNLHSRIKGPAVDLTYNMIGSKNEAGCGGYCGCEIPDLTVILGLCWIARPDRICPDSYSQLRLLSGEIRISPVGISVRSGLGSLSQKA